ncbi:MAG: hypothetical protein ACREBJ_11045 [Nitrosotalea sp.]
MTKQDELDKQENPVYEDCACNICKAVCPNCGSNLVSEFNLCPQCIAEFKKDEIRESLREY